MNMASPPPDLDGSPLELLIKLMRMTDAEDNIALVAIKKANSHLKKLGTDWEALLRGKVKIIADPFASINIPTAGPMNPNRNQPYTPPQRPAPPPPPPPPNTTVPPASAFSSGPAYSPPPRSTPPRPKGQHTPVKPKPGAPAFSGDACEKTIVNRFDGICTKCQNKVLTGDGVAKLWCRPGGKTTYWTTEHSGPCPTTKPTRSANTIDNFQV